MKIPRIVLAGTYSGVGKTTLATGLMAALTQRGRPVQGYKIGPDYIDPGYHAAATGKISRNLDRWLLGNRLSTVFAQSSREKWVVIEGVMGLFDGMNQTQGFGSTADVAKLLHSPVILIVDASSMSRSVAALVHGFNSFDPQISLQGVILNRVKSKAQEQIQRDALGELGMPVLGVFPLESSLRLPERHLGLVPTGEGGLPEGFINNLAGLIAQHIDLSQVESIMLAAPDFPELIPALQPKVFGRKFRLGLARDEAFLFYYQDALELAERLNCTIVPFSPLHDTALPRNLDGIFLGGGFPELYLEGLSRNVRFLQSLKHFAESGKPIYAECGGYMYLGQSITNFEGKKFPLSGIIPMQAEMTKRLQGMGYRRGVFQTDNFLGPRGTAVQGHEFHYSRVIFEKDYPAAYELFKGEHSDRMEGYSRDNIVASYLHLHFSGYPQLLKHWFSSVSGGLSV